MCALISVFAAVGCGAHDPSDARKLEARAEDCASCHADEWRATRAPVHASLGFGQQCGDCHDQAAWRPTPGYGHTASFPLTLGHATPPCSACHVDGFAAGTTPNTCVACHGARATAVPDPVHAKLSTSCAACHKTDAFRPSMFRHAWPLSGAHALLACGSCHGTNPARYEGTQPDCRSCHEDDRQRADRVVSGHVSYPSDCTSCHGFEAFLPSLTK